MVTTIFEINAHVLCFCVKQEFEDYYEGVSLGFENDKEFTAMMRNCWGI